jgi:hypothetical protein
VKSVRSICALLLLAAWPVLTSHALLEELHLIHVVHDDHHGSEDSHEHNTENHQFADGQYSSSSGSVQIAKPQIGPVLFSLRESLLASPVLMETVPGPAPPGSAPPFLSSSWQFLSRTALPVRAPSSLL